RQQRGKAKAAGTVGHALDVQRRLAGLVEGQLEVVAVQQVDAVERSILRGGGDLGDDVVVLADQVGTDGLGGGVRHRGGDGQAGDRRAAGDVDLAGDDR